MRLRFTIRDLLWLAVVVALAVGWWVDRRSIQRQSAIEFNEFRQAVVDHEKPRPLQPIPGGGVGGGRRPEPPPIRIPAEKPLP
jgi:hypothetical protein